MKFNYPSWIDEAEAATYNGFSHMDLRTIEPIDYFHFFPLYGDLWIDKVYEAVSIFEQMDVHTKNECELLPNPSSLRVMILFFIYNYRHVQNRDSKKIRKVLNFFTDTLQKKCPTDTFAMSKNLCQTEETVEKIFKTINFQKTTPKIVRELGRNYLGASSLVNAIMNDVCTDNGIEVSGPYYNIDGSILLIKEFPRLRPTELWPEIQNLPFEKITQFNIYKDVSVVIELVGCHFAITGKPVSEAMTQYAIEVDGKTLTSLEEIQKFNESLLEYASNIYKVVKNMSMDEKKVLAQEQEGYQLKDFFDYVGIDWRPTQEMNNRVVGKNLLTGLLSEDFNKQTFADDFGYNLIKKVYSE